MLGALVAGGASLLSGLFGRSSAKKQAKKEEAAIRQANERAQEAAAKMNAEVRARADKAALVPVQTARSHVDLSDTFSGVTGGSRVSQLGRSTTTGAVDMKAFMAAAEQNGFNPLTFLRSGALALFASTDTKSFSSTTEDYWSKTASRVSSSSDDFTCTTGERAMDAALAGQYIPQLQPVIAQTKVPGFGDILGGAIQSGANQYLNDLSQAENNQFQMDLLNAQLAGAQRNRAYVPRSAYVPSAYLTGSVSSGPGLKQPAIPNLMDTYLDNRPDSKTYGQKILMPSSNLSAEAFGALGLADVGGRDAGTFFQIPPFKGSAVEQLFKNLPSLPAWTALPGPGVYVTHPPNPSVGRPRT